MLGFKALLDAWRGREVVSETFGRSQQMLEDAGAIFRIACDAMTGRMAPDSAREEIKALDKQINRTQRDIRRMIVEHLVANPGTDVPACLVLMSIVKDAERLGDYARDMFYAWSTCPQATGEAKYASMLAAIQADVAAMMQDARKALGESDETLANDVMAARTR
jgi:phosphate uptake regulator